MTVRFDPAGTDGTDVANITGVIDQVVKSGTGTVKYKTSAGAGRGNQIGVEITAPAVGDTAYFGMPAAVTTDPAAADQAWFQWPTSSDFGVGNALIEFGKFRSGTVATGANLGGRLFIASSDNSTRTAGTLVVETAGGGILTTTSAFPVLSAGTWYRIEAGVKPGSTTTNGYVEARVYDDSDTLVWSLGHPASDVAEVTAGLVPTRVIFGKPGSGGNGFKMWVTQTGVDTGATPPTIPTVAKVGTLAVPTCTVSPTSGPAPRSDGTNGTTFVTSISSTGGSANPKTYALKVYRVSTNAVVYDTTASYQSSPSISWTPAVGTTPDDYDFEPYVQQVP